MVRSICDTSYDIGSDWSKLDTVVEVILTVHVQHAEQYYKNICSQVKELTCLTRSCMYVIYLVCNVHLCIMILPYPSLDCITDHSRISSLHL